MFLKQEELKRVYHIKIFLTIAMLFSFVLVYFPVWKGLIQAWYNSDDYSHGFFIVPLVVYSLWLKRKDLYGLPIQSSVLGLILIIASLILYLLAFYAEIKTVASLAMIFSISGVVLFVYGWTIFREVFFVLLFLPFMIPVPAQIYSAMTIPLQLIVSQVSVYIAMLFGLPVFREGNVIHLPEHTLEVVQACSGLRSLMSLLTLNMVVAYFTLRSNWLRVVLVMSGVPIAIIVNIFRVLITIIAFYFFDFDLTEDSVHTIFGIVVFGLAVALVFLIKGVLSFWDRPEITKL